MSRTILRVPARWAAAAVAATTLLWLASSAQAAPQSAVSPASTPPVRTVGINLSSPSDTGASDVSNVGSAGWRVQSSAVATQTGAQISTPGFDTSTWLPVTNDDAGAPGTEIEALAQNGKCPGDTALQPVNQGTSGASSVFFSANMKSCYGFMSATGADTVKEFSVPWWWRTDFTPNLQAGPVATLIVNGVVGSANVWVNGQEVATSATVTGAYTRFSLSLTKLVKTGTNSLAIEVNPNNPNTMFTLDDVDWNQIPPANNTSTAQAGQVTATITPPGGGTPVTVSQSVTIPAQATHTVSFTPSAGHQRLRLERAQARQRGASAVTTERRNDRAP